MTKLERRETLWMETYIRSIGAPMSIPEQAADRALHEYDKRFPDEKIKDSESVAELCRRKLAEAGSL
jgi:hypothetical protein